MSSYELCIGTDAPGGGDMYASLQDAKVAGWARVGPVDNPPGVPFEDFFTVHEVASGDRPPLLVFDSRNEHADA
jgi:hypothetical protein